MASAKGKEIWLIVSLVIIAVLVTVLAFKKEKPVAQVPTQDVFADKGEIAGGQQALTGGIKPNHSESDMESIAATKPAPAVVEAKVITPVETYAIQVYSFKEKARLEAALKALKNKNYPAYIMVSDLGPRGIWYRVRVGTFTSEADAKNSLASVMQDFKSGIIVTE